MELLSFEEEYLSVSCYDLIMMTRLKLVSKLTICLKSWLDYVFLFGQLREESRNRTINNALLWEQRMNVQIKNSYLIPYYRQTNRSYAKKTWGLICCQFVQIPETGHRKT